MKKFIFLIVLLSFNIYLSAQTKKVNSIGISIPVIWNKSSGVFYQLGTRKEPEGKSVSNGLNINYNRTLYKNFYVIAGLGSFTQRFNIIRPFDFNTQIRFLFSTKKYKYFNLQFSGGFGYNKNVLRKYDLNFGLVYNNFISYKQEYFLNYGSTDSSQTNNFSKNIGNSVNLNLGIDKNLYKKLSIEATLVFPLITKWNNDKIFFEYPYSDDTQKIANTKFSYGVSASIKYHF